MTSHGATAGGHRGLVEIDERYVLRFRREIAAVELDGETVLLDGDTGAVHMLNQTATLVWGCSDGSTRLGMLIDDFADVFPQVPRTIIAEEVTALVRTMASMGLLQDSRDRRGHEPPAPAQTVDPPTILAEPPNL